MLKSILTVMTIFLIFLFTSAQGVIMGYVTDKQTGDKIEGINVIISNTDKGDLSDFNGFFIINDISYGSYNIVAKRIGYIDDTMDVTINSNDIIPMNFILQPTSIKMEGIVVTATKSSRYIMDVPIRTEIITEKAIIEKNALNLYDALTGIPGIIVEQQCQYCNFSQIRLQGLGADHTQILIDNMPVYSGLASVYGLQQIGSANIDHIEIVKGAGSALYGSSAIAGAINIITKKPSDKYTTNINLQYGNNNKYNANVNTSFKYNKIAVQFNVQKSGADAIDESSESGNIPDGISDMVKADLTNLSARIYIYDILKNDILSMGISNINELRQGGTLTDNLYLNPFSEGTEYIQTNRYTLDLMYKKLINKSNNVSLMISGSKHLRNATNDAFLGDYMETHNDSSPPIDEFRPYIANEDLIAVTFDYMNSFFNRHNLLMGVQYVYNDLTESGKYIIVDEMDSLYGIPYTSSSNKHSNEIGLYIQDEYSINRYLEVVAGIRYDIHNSEDNFRGSNQVASNTFPAVEYSKNVYNPRIAIKFTPFRSFSIRTSFGTGFKVPYGFSEDLHLCSGSPRVWKSGDLRPEKSKSFNLSIDYEILNNITTSINIYRTNLEDKTGFSEAGGDIKSLGYTYQWVNIDNAYVQGIETELNINIIKELALNLDFTYSKGQYDNERDDWIGTEFASISKYIPRIPKYAGRAELKFISNWCNIFIEGNYHGTMYIDYFSEDGNLNKIKITEPYILFNTRISKKLFNTFEVYCGLKNITDYIQPEKHLDDAAFMYAPTFGREIYGGIILSIK